MAEEYTDEYLLGVTDQELEKIVREQPTSLKKVGRPVIERINNIINPYARVIKNEGYTVLSVLNDRASFFTRLKITALVGYLFRAEYEWGTFELENEPQNQELKDRIASERVIISKFLNSLFEYNPSEHIDTDMRNLLNNNEARKELREQVKENYGDVLRRYSAKQRTVPDILKYTHLDDASPVSTAEFDLTADQHGLASALAKRVPANFFHGLNYYFEANFEQLKFITRYLYDVVEDIDLSVGIWGNFDKKKHAEKFLQQSKNVLNVDTMCIPNGGWVMLGAFQRNRERIDFYTQETEILKRIVQSHEQDAKIGKELVKKRAKRKKIQQTLKSGPNAPGLRTKYARDMGIEEEMASAGINSIDDADPEIQEAINEYKRNNPDNDEKTTPPPNQTYVPLGEDTKEHNEEHDVKEHDEEEYTYEDAETGQPLLECQTVDLPVHVLDGSTGEFTTQTEVIRALENSGHVY